MRKLFIVAVLALGCTSFTGPDGIYTLTTVNGYRVPFTIGHAINPPEELLIEIADGTLTVTDGRYEQRVAIRTTRRVCIVPDCTLQVERNVIEATGLVQTSQGQRKSWIDGFEIEQHGNRVALDYRYQADVFRLEFVR